jgi:hypothetical protein
MVGIVNNEVKHTSLTQAIKHEAKLDTSLTRVVEILST